MVKIEMYLQWFLKRRSAVRMGCDYLGTTEDNTSCFSTRKYCRWPSFRQHHPQQIGSADFCPPVGSRALDIITYTYL